jgi:hypothetical protein
MHKLRVVSIGSSLVALLAAPLAHAEEGEFQLGLATPFLVYQKSTVDTEPEETKVSETEWGITHDVVAEIGYGVTPNLVVGGLVKLGGDSETTEIDDEETDSSTFDLLLGPKLDYVLSPGDKVQPFVGGVIGYLSTSSSAEDFDTSISGFQFMARGGVRIFPGKEFSIDPWLGLSYFTGSTEVDSDNFNEDYDTSGFQVGVYLGISGWL